MEEDKQVKPITLFVKPEIKQRMVDAAHLEKVTLSEFIRRACIARAEHLERVGK